MNKQTLIAVMVLAATSCFNGLRAHELSTRGNVGTGDNVMIGGLIVEELDCRCDECDGGLRAAAFVIRVLGPSLLNAGVSGVLMDPQVAFYDAQGNLIGGQMDYTEVDIPTQQIIYDHGLSPHDIREVALYVQILPGFYTAIVSGQDGGTGIALLEAYKL